MKFIKTAIAILIFLGNLNAMNWPEKLTVTCKNQKVFALRKKVYLLSETLKVFVKDYPNQSYNLPEVSSNEFEITLKLMKKLASLKTTNPNLTKFNFLSKNTLPQLRSLLDVANFLDSEKSKKVLAYFIAQKFQNNNENIDKYLQQNIEDQTNKEYILSEYKIFQVKKLSNNEDLCPYLMQACSNGQWNIVKVLVQKDALKQLEQKGLPKIVIMQIKNKIKDAFEKDEKLSIFEAAISEPIKIFKLLFSKENINNKNRNGDTALICASRVGNAKVVEFLLAKGAKIGLRNNSGSTALIAASKKGHKEIIKLLLKQDINEHEKIKAFEKAKVNRHKQIAKLIKKASNISTKFPKIRIPKNTFSKNNKDKKSLLSVPPFVSIFEKYYKNISPLIYASRGGNKEEIKLVLESGALFNIEERDNMSLGFTALMWACNKGLKEIVELLLSRNANVNTKDINGWTPLSWACFEGYKEIVEILLAHNADVNTKDINGWTPLIWPCFKGYKEIVEILLAHNADVNAKNRFGYTPLVLACKKGYKEIVEILLTYGADINAKDDDRNTPLLLACENGYKGIAEILS